MRILTLGISGLPFESPRTKWHMGIGPMIRHRVYNKGKSDGFPQVRAVMNLMSSSLLVTHPSAKRVPATH